MARYLYNINMKASKGLCNSSSLQKHLPRLSKRLSFILAKTNSCDLPRCVGKITQTKLDAEVLYQNLQLF